MTNDELQHLIDQVTQNLDAEALFHAFFYTTDGLIQRGKERGLEIPYDRINSAVKRQIKSKPRGPVLDGLLIGGKVWAITRQSGDLWLAHQEKKYIKSKK